MRLMVQERAAFIRKIDLIREKITTNPTCHVSENL
jgi:hypothetical protein